MTDYEDIKFGEGQNNYYDEENMEDLSDED
jgi:hypothetical protein